MINEYIRKSINDNIDLGYKDFQAKLVPSINTVEGVRVPVLKKIAKEVSSFSDIKEYLHNPVLNTYEERMIYGLVLGYLKLPFSDLEKYLEFFIPFIDNWAVCDTCISNLKIVKKNKDECLKFILKYLKSKNEYDLRFMIVVLNDYYLDDLKLVFSILDKIKCNYYYVDMAIAWTISSAYKKDRNYTLNYLENSKLSFDIKKKAKQKIRELSCVNK